MMVIKCTRCNKLLEYNDINFYTKRKTYICRECNSKLLAIQKYKRKYDIKLSFEKLYYTYDIIQWFEFLLDKKIYRNILF